jgi:hypothetical protein
VDDAEKHNVVEPVVAHAVGFRGKSISKFGQSSFESFGLAAGL